jgi:hypothetical protein
MKMLEFLREGSGVRNDTVYIFSIDLRCGFSGRDDCYVSLTGCIELLA